MEENNKVVMFDYENWNADRLSDHLAKYIRYKDDCYCLIIHKNDWDGYEDHSWLVYYAKENVTSFNIQKPLIKVSGSTLHKALINMAIAYYQFKEKNAGNPDYYWKL